MFDKFSLDCIPKEPGVLAYYGAGQRPVYLTSTNRLLGCVEFNLLRRGGVFSSRSSSAVTINPDKITRVTWWVHDEFLDRSKLRAATVLASEILKPKLSIGLASRANDEIEAFQDCEDFNESMKALFHSSPSGSFVPTNLGNLASLVFELRECVELLQNNKFLEEQELGNLLNYCWDENRISPRAIPWRELHEMLRFREIAGASSRELTHLPILGGWINEPKSRQEYFVDHVRWGAEHGLVWSVSRFLRSLDPESWTYAEGDGA